MYSDKVTPTTKDVSHQNIFRWRKISSETELSKSFIWAVFGVLVGEKHKTLSSEMLPVILTEVFKNDSTLSITLPPLHSHVVIPTCDPKSQYMFIHIWVIFWSDLNISRFRYYIFKSSLLLGNMNENVLVWFPLY